VERGGVGVAEGESEKRKGRVKSGGEREREVKKWKGVLRKWGGGFLKIAFSQRQYNTRVQRDWKK
jgi:hypothetical protein